MGYEAVFNYISGFDFSQVDLDNDGWVDSLVVIHAGCGEEAGASSYTIWSHRWNLTSTFTTHDGKKIYDYTTVPEKRGNNEYYNDITRIGVICTIKSYFKYADLYVSKILVRALEIFALWRQVMGRRFG
jgi:hypothetical protein